MDTPGRVRVDPVASALEQFNTPAPKPIHAQQTPIHAAGASVEDQIRDAVEAATAQYKDDAVVLQVSIALPTSDYDLNSIPVSLKSTI